MAQPTETRNERLKLSLYIAGMAERSLKAIDSVKRFCESELNGEVELEIVDIYLNPEIARRNQIIAVPCLVREAPKPVRIVIGDLSNADKMRSLSGLAERGNFGPSERI